MEQKNERKVLSRKQMTTKLLDSFFGWGILFGLAVSLATYVIDIPLAKFLEGTVYSIVTAIVTLIGYAVQWMFTARIAVKKTFEKYTVNKDQSKGILNKSIIFFSVLNLLVAGVNIYRIIEANKALAFWGAEVDITLPIILQAIISVGAVGIIIYMSNTQKEYIETQCVEGMPEEKLKMSVAEKVLLIIIGVILVVAIGWGIKVGVIDRQAMEDDEYDYGFIEDEEDNSWEEFLNTETDIEDNYEENVEDQELQEEQVTENTENANTEQNENNNEIETEDSKENKEEIKIEYKNIVETTVEKHETKTGNVPCEDEITAQIDIMIPKINIDTANVSKINKEIMKQAEDELEALDEEMVYGDISFLYKYTNVASRNILAVLITEGYGAFCRTGSTQYTSYIYDIKNDKILTNKEVLEIYDIDDKLLKENAYEYINKNEYEDEETIDSYKERVDEIIKNKEYVITDISENTVSIYFNIHLEGITVVY